MTDQNQKMARKAQSKGNAAFFDGKYEDAITEYAALPSQGCTIFKI